MLGYWIFTILSPVWTFTTITCRLAFWIDAKRRDWGQQGLCKEMEPRNARSIWDCKKNNKRVRKRNKRNYEGKVRSSVLHPGDRVLVRNLTPRGGTGKLQNIWEDAIHTVVCRVGEESPVYEVKLEWGNLLLPCDFLPLELEPQPHPRTKKKTKELFSSERHDSSSEDVGEECG